MKTAKLIPATKDYVWGGEKLIRYGVTSKTLPIAEAWALSMNEDGLSEIETDNGIATLKSVASPDDFGENCARFPFFPVLIKLIDSASNLSVQVHPSDEYALKNEGQLGKTEMWCILDAEEGSGIYLGFKKDTSKEEVLAKSNDGTIMDLLNFFPVKKGEVYFVPPGTPHAIGGGVTLLEIQQNSTLTYRLYDYGRLGKDGKPRELHVEKALAVLDYRKYAPVRFEKPCLGQCDYFVTEEARLADEIIGRSDSFVFACVVEGNATVDGLDAKVGSCFFVPAGQKARVKGDCRAIVVHVPCACHR